MPRPDDRLPRMTFARDRITQYEITTTAGQEPRITLEHDNGRSYSGILVDINDDEITIVRDVRLDIGEIENPTPIGRVTLNNQVMGVARDVRLDIGEIGEPEPELEQRLGELEMKIEEACFIIEINIKSTIVNLIIGKGNMGR